MTDAEDLAVRMAQATSARSETGIFVRMDGRFAVVNVGTSTVTVPCIGFYPPVAGMAVRVEWVDGSPAVKGPIRPLSPLGTITATGTPRATVTVGGTAYPLFYRSGYTPALNDLVEINWATGIIQGKVTGVDNPSSPGESGGGAVPFEVVVRAANSGRFQSGSGWWGRGPWASSSNNGVWVYESRVADAVGSGTVTRTEIYLPLISEVGLASIGLHDYWSLPAGAPTIGSLSALALGNRSGWVLLPPTFGPYLAAGGRGIGVVAPGGGGYTRWRGIDEDSLSGALRISGTR